MYINYALWLLAENSLKHLRIVLAILVEEILPNPTFEGTFWLMYLETYKHINFTTKINLKWETVLILLLFVLEVFKMNKLKFEKIIYAHDKANFRRWN